VHISSIQGIGKGRIKYCLVGCAEHQRRTWPASSRLREGRSRLPGETTSVLPAPALHLRELPGVALPGPRLSNATAAATKPIAVTTSMPPRERRGAVFDYNIGVIINSTAAGYRFHAFILRYTRLYS
ncbi:unnamed protein product, partial [Ectocarpus sp. 4 AP-2014]